MQDTLYLGKHGSRIVAQSKRQVWGQAQGALQNSHGAHVFSIRSSTGSAIMFGLVLASCPAQSKQDLHASMILARDWCSLCACAVPQGKQGRGKGVMGKGGWG